MWRLFPLLRAFITVTSLPPPNFGVGLLLRWLALDLMLSSFAWWMENDADAFQTSFFLLFLFTSRRDIGLKGTWANLRPRPSNMKRLSMLPRSSNSAEAIRFMIGYQRVEGTVKPCLNEPKNNENLTLTDVTLGPQTFFFWFYILDKMWQMWMKVVPSNPLERSF